MHKNYSGVLAADAERHMRWDLQLFAGEGASSGGEGGDGSSAAGPQSSEGGQDSMEFLGIPKEKLEKYRSAKARQAVKPQAEEPEAVEPEAPKQDDAAAPEETPKEQAQDFDAMLKTPEFNQRVQDIVQRRVANMKASLDALTPALEILGQKYGMDVSNLDFKALAEKIQSDDSYFESRAEEMGSSPETARKVWQAEQIEKRRESTARDEMLQRHFDDLTRQAEVLKQKYPSFNMEEEMRDARFRRMTMPGGGLNLEQAYTAIHHEEILKAAQEAAVRQAAQALSNSIQSGKNLPAENGSVQRGAVEAQPKLYSQMTPEERRIEKARITGKPIGR